MTTIRKIFRRGLKKCFAVGCKEMIPRQFLMCRKHWSFCPNSIQYAIYNTLDIWRRGGSFRLYIDTIKDARIAVAKREQNKAYWH